LTRTPTPAPVLKSPDAKSSVFSQTLPESKKAANFTNSMIGKVYSTFAVNRLSPPTGSFVLESSGPTLRSSYPRMLRDLQSQVQRLEEKIKDKDLSA